MEPIVYVLKNEFLEVHVGAWGATLQRMLVTGKDGRRRDVLLGLEHPEGYAGVEYAATGAYLGALVGRYANRIADGRFTLEGREYQLAVNNGRNHLHGGVCGFDKQLWSKTYFADNALVLRYVSPDGEEGYPGTLEVQVGFVLSGKELKITYQAWVDKPCPVNLTHHPYFNLCGGVGNVKSHVLRLYTDKYLQTEDLIPDGMVVSAIGGGCNFNNPVALQAVIEERGGLDDCFVFGSGGDVKRMAELSEPLSGMTLYVASDYPGLQVYTGKYLDVPGGIGGVHYGAYAGIALEAQYFPDSPNHPEFPSTLLMPGEEYCKTIVYGFES